MFLMLFLLFVLVPVIELSVLIRVGEVLGPWTTAGLVLFTAVVGVSLVRSQGLSTLMQAQQKLALGDAPGQEIVEGMMLAMAGVLLLIPGFVTDFVGILLLTPFTRRPIAAWFFKRMQLRVVSSLNGSMHSPFGKDGGRQSHPFGQSPFEQDKSGGNVYEGDFERKDADDKAERLVNKPSAENDKEPRG
ncbi:MAG: FxsA family protein [Shewanella sp.]